MRVTIVLALMLLGVVMLILAHPEPRAHPKPQRGAGRLGRSAEPQRADKRRKPGKYRNPEYSGGDHYGPAYNKPYGAAGAASSASSAASASSGAAGHGGVAHSNSHSLSNSASVGAGPYGASISNSQSSANSGALAIGGYRGKPRPPYHPPESEDY